ncbi:MAG: hypothetical protein K8S54_05730 [Spirochaetia bacterium]|nr:hypothetical protein [Spirochaetia bacterium]
MIWDWIKSWFGLTPAISEDPGPVRFRVDDLVWYLHFDERREAGAFPSLNEPVVLKQFRVTQVTQVRYKKEVMHTVYTIESDGVTLNVHESFLAATPIEAVDGIPVEFL